MVAKYHEAGLEVILDVVYNHTAEGNEKGPTLSFKGIDNASYYRLLPDQPRYYINETGTGNTVNVSHPRVLQMVMDSLRYWVEGTNVDGFRFDLGTILAREPNGFDNKSGFLKACSQDPLLQTVKLIAEPWDCGPGGYQVGGFPPGWAEWNDKFRDTVRDFWRDQAPASELTERICASNAVFNHHGRKPWASVNFLTAHGGFTLNDIVTYNEKHNDAKAARTTTTAALTIAHGTAALRDLPTTRRSQRPAFAADPQYAGHVAAFAGHAHAARGRRVWQNAGGNNNAYCQDSEISC
ncbi:alpha-amylase family glycosyl hydrolase [Acidipila sp. EB88]|uniref:alpha-amylase family glycosyl hydrolase n=1 Tax=Acidipila sp. EB88 TaxID=2305226 RepID=UPI0018F43378|nr:alpha-amylase family glycosyl hydrolase [Acidipila sp. EB88]